MLLTPHWLYYLFGASMFAVAGYSALLLVIGLVSRRSVGIDVELSHIVMGLAMAGMFVGRWAFGPNLAWELAFAAFLVWFVARAVLSVQRFGLHLPHTLIHALMSVAMLLMYWFPASMSAQGGGMGSAMGSGMGSQMGGRGVPAHVDPGLVLLLAVALFASAIFTLASPRKGWSVYGAVVPPGLAAATADGSVADEVEAAVAPPLLVDVTHVVMCVAMGFMLVLML